MMKQNRVLKNSILGFSSWFLPIVFGIIATPIILTRLGEKNYGLFMLIAGFVSYSFTFNISRAITRYVAEYNATGEIDKANEIIVTTLLLNLIVGGFGFLTIVLATNWLVSDVFLIDQELRSTARNGFYIAALTILFIMLGQAFSAILQGIQRFDTYTAIVTITSLLLAIGNLVIVFINPDVQLLLIWNLIIAGFGLIGYFVFTRKYCTFANYTLNSRLLKLVLIYGSGVTIYQICGNLIMLFERSLITRMFGQETLTFYVVPMTFGIYVHALIASLTVAIFPVTSELGGVENRERLLSIYTKASKIVLAIVCCAGVVLIAGNRIVLQLWIGGELGEKFSQKSSDVLTVQVITFGLLALVIISWILVEAIKDASFNALQSLIWLIITIPSMILLAPKYSSFGIALGRLAGVSIIPITILISEKWIFGKPLWRFWGKNLIIISFAIVVVYFFEAFMLTNLSQTRLIFTLEATIVASSFLVIVYFLGYLDVNERAWLKELLKFKK